MVAKLVSLVPHSSGLLFAGDMAKLGYMLPCLRLCTKLAEF